MVSFLASTACRAMSRRQLVGDAPADAIIGFGVKMFQMLIDAITLLIAAAASLPACYVYFIFAADGRFSLPRAMPGFEVAMD